METASVGCLGADSRDGLASTERQHTSQNVGCSCPAILGSGARSVEGLEANGELGFFSAGAEFRRGVLLGSSDRLRAAFEMEGYFNPFVLARTGLPSDSEPGNDTWCDRLSNAVEQGRTARRKPESITFALHV